MAVRKVVIWPDPVLSAVAKPVATVDDSVRQLVRDMFDTMYYANGVGLAAPQVGVSQRILVIDLNPKGRARGEELDDLKAQGFDGPRAFINAEIIKKDGKIVWEEGCLSVPGINEEVERAEHVVVRALDEQGKVFEKEMAGLYAVAIQHELDHLNGKVFVEYLSRLKRDVIKKKMQKIQQTSDDYYKEQREDADDDSKAAI
ncbi:MAG: peptide deformylase [Deltaproteobacteria bacterium]|nr:peptide deformylase [Deltaproteobacteria bacterium]